MYIFKTVNDLQNFIALKRNEGKQIGFVPTMGALHQGHLSLLKVANQQTQISVCSIFVNPKQFDEAEDFDKYPRTTTQDIQLLEENNCTVLFLPTVAEVFPPAIEQDLVQYDFGYLAKPMEGAYRKGHFDGMAKVVKRLLDIVLPDKLFMGQKDYQQFTIVRRLIEITNLQTQLVVCPILREADGLAMSSRNVRLLTDERIRAAEISQTLKWLKLQRNQLTLNDAITKAKTKLNTITGMSLEYLEVVNGRTLTPITNWTNTDAIVACVAVRLGAVRLIDNMIL